MAESFDVVFHGNSESECINFIRAVRRHAKVNGIIRDNAWIADELYDAFDGKALKWYVRLPEDVQGDWGRLQEALLTRWTTDDDDDDITRNSSLAILPTPTAAPAASPSSSTPSRASRSGSIGKVGRARIRANGRADVRYLSKDYQEGVFIVTANPAEALKVRLITTTPSFCRVEIVEHKSGLSVLAAYCSHQKDWNIWGGLIGVDAPGEGLLTDHRTTFAAGSVDDQFWTERWQIGSAGVLKLRGPGDTAEIARFILGLQDPVKDTLSLGSPKLSFSSQYFSDVDLEFSPLGN